MDLLGLIFLIVFVVGVVLFIRQMRFGTSAQRLARTIAEEGGFERDLERDHRGKVVPHVAAEQLNDWRGWFQLGVALGDMRNPAAARSAVRRAVALERTNPDFRE